MESSGFSEDILHKARVLGVLSDTHDNVVTAAAGIAALREAGAEFLIHCGDVGGQPIFDLMAAIPSAFVWGNCDFDRVSLKIYAEELGIQCCDEFGSLEIGGKKVAFTHGDNAKLIRQATDQESGFDYAFYGHTHVAADRKFGNTRLINPGALHRATKKTVALVELDKGIVRWVEV